MDHSALARMFLRGKQDHDVRAEVRAFLEADRSKSRAAESTTAYHADLTKEERLLSCASCHSKEDPHTGRFGSDCAQCHRTKRWSLAEFRHPSPHSMDCSQCHSAPACHFFGKFFRACTQVAAQADAEVSECYRCHKTTKWNDIKGVGWYKTH